MNGDASVCTGGVSQNKSANAVLTANITVNKDVLNANGQPNGEGDAFRKWTPIGQSFTKAYSGTFDGQGHTISGLWHWWSTDYIGLFGNNEGTIKNLGVVDSYLSGHENVGGVCGKNGGSLTNCYNTGPIYGVNYIGGVCGMNSGSLTNCYNTGNVQGKKMSVVCADGMTAITPTSPTAITSQKPRLWKTTKPPTSRLELIVLA